MRVAALAVALAVALAAPALAHADDFGDAPDRRPAAYPDRPSVLGTFPSLAAHKGPRHGELGPHLGLAPSSEADSKQVDRDRDEGASLTVRRCGASTLTVIIDARSLPPGAATVYVNAWFDWNADGDWLDGRARAGCGPEWGVQNVRIDLRRFPADRFLSVPITFRSGAPPPEFWWRVQVQAEAEADHRGGAAGKAYLGGETEDYFQHTRTVGDEEQPPPAVPPPRYRCWASGDVLEHGPDSLHMFEATPTNYALSDPMKVTGLRAELLGQTDGVRIANGYVFGNAVRVFSSASREHVRNPRVQFMRVVIRFDVRVRERTFSLRVNCPFAISHTSWLAPIRAPQVIVRPGRPFELPNVPRLCRIEPTFAVDGARIPDNGFVNFGVAISFPKGVRFQTLFGQIALVTDTATGRTPPLDFFGALFPWRLTPRQRVDERDPARIVVDFIVQVVDQRPETPTPRRGTWRIGVGYTPPANVQSCDARVR